MIFRPHHFKLGYNDRVIFAFKQLIFKQIKQTSIAEGFNILILLVNSNFQPQFAFNLMYWPV